METNKGNNVIPLNEKKFEELFRNYFSVLCLFANKIIPDFDSAKEVVHEVFINLWERRNKVDATKSFKSYLYTSVHNRCLNFVRDHKKFQQNIDIERIKHEEFSENSDSIVEIEMREKIINTIDSLPEKCKKVFELSRYEGFKYSEIAQKLNISVKTVEAQMSKALKILRENLIEYLTILIFIMYELFKK